MISPLALGIISFYGLASHIAYDTYKVVQDEKKFKTILKPSQLTDESFFVSINPSFYPAALAIKFLASFALLIAARYFSISYARYFPYTHFSFMLMGTSAFATYEMGSLITLVKKFYLQQKLKEAFF